MVDPGKCGFLSFARGSVRWLTLANCIFWSLPGVEWVCATLANCVFGTLPGVIEVCLTLANVVFCRLPGVIGVG